MKRTSVKPRSRLSARERSLFHSFEGDELDLRYNWARRLRNALLCLARCDPRWMIFIEREIVPDMELREATRLIEARARLIVLKAHSFFGRNIIGEFIFRDDWVFTDRGNLGPG